MQKYLAVIHQQSMELLQFLLPAKEPPAGSGNIGIKDIIHYRRGQIALCQQLLLPYIPLFKPELHGKAENLHDEDRFIVFILKSITVRQFHLLLG